MNISGKRTQIVWKESQDPKNPHLEGGFVFKGRKYKIAVECSGGQARLPKLIEQAFEGLSASQIADFDGAKRVRISGKSIEIQGSTKSKACLNTADKIAGIIKKEIFVHGNQEVFSFSVCQEQSKPKQRGRTAGQKIDKKIFAHLHTPHLIAKTKFEGGQMHENTLAMRQVVDSLHQSKSTKEDDKDILAKTALFLKSKHQFEQKFGEYSSAAGLHKEIVRQLKTLKEGEAVYIPAGWSGLGEKPGHAATLKIYKKEDKVCFYLINKGAGSEYHSMLKTVSGGQTKYDIRSDIYQMSSANFEGEKGRNFIRALQELKHPELAASWVQRVWAHIKDFFTGYSCGFVEHLFESCMPVNGVDLYGVCTVFTEGVEKKEGYSDAYASTRQISGNCTQASLNACLLDYLLGQGFKREQVDRLIFLIKQQSLENAYHGWAENPDPDMALLLRNAAEQHLIRVVQNDALSETEKNAASSLANEIIEDPSLRKSPAPIFEIPGNNERKIVPGKASAQRISIQSISPKGNAKVALHGQPIVSEIAQLETPKTGDDALTFLKKVQELAQKAEQSESDPQSLLIDLTIAIDRLPATGGAFWQNIGNAKSREMLEKIDALGMLLMRLHQKLHNAEAAADLQKLEQSLAILYEISIYVSDPIFPTLKNYRVMIPPICTNLTDSSSARRSRMQKIQRNLEERNKKIKDEEEEGNPEDKILFNPGLFTVGRKQKKRQIATESFLGDLDPGYHSRIDKIHQEDRNGGAMVDFDACFAFRECQKELVKKNAAYRQLLSAAFRCTVPKVDIDNEENWDFDSAMEKEAFGVNSDSQKLEIWSFKKIDKEPLLDPQNSTCADKTAHRYDTKTCENLILCETNKYELRAVLPGVSNSRLMELTRMLIAPQSAPTLVMAWLTQRSNRNLLIHPEIREMVQKCLFSDHFLARILEQETNKACFIKLFHEFEGALHSLLRENARIDTKTLESHLFMLRMVEALEKEIPSEAAFSVKKEMEGLLKTESLSLAQKQRVASAYLSRFLDKSVEGSEQEFLLAFFIHKTSLQSRDAISLKAEEVLRLHHKTAWRWVAENAGDFAALILSQLESIQLKKEKISFEDDTVLCGDFKIHSTGILEKMTAAAFPLPSYLVRTDLYQEFFGKQQVKDFKIKNGFLEQAEGDLRLLVDSGANLAAVDKRLKIGEETVWARYQSKRQLGDFCQKQHLSPLFFKSPNKTFVEVGKSSPRMFVLDESGAVLYIISSETNKVCDLKGREIVSLSNLQSEKWSAFCKLLDHPKFVNAGIEKGEINSLNFTRLGLQFEHTEKGWASKQYPGFFIAEQQSEMGFVIQNEKGIKKLLLPFHPTQDTAKKRNKQIAEKMMELSRTSGFSLIKRFRIQRQILQLKKEGAAETEKSNRYFEAGMNLDLDTNEDSIPCFVYEEKRGKWHAETPQASLYLSICFRAHGDYARAIEQLNDASSPLGLSELDLRIEKELWKREDLSPEGVAFDLHFCHRMAVHDKKRVRDVRADQKQREELKQLRKTQQTERGRRISDLKNSYKNFQSDKKQYINKIPQALRLNDFQKRDLGNLLPKNVPPVAEPEKVSESPSPLEGEYFKFFTEKELKKQIEAFDILAMNPLWELDEKDPQARVQAFLLKRAIPNAVDFDPARIRPVMQKNISEGSLIVPGLDGLISPLHGYLIKNCEAILAAAANPAKREETLRHLVLLGRYSGQGQQIFDSLRVLLCLACCMPEVELQKILEEKTPLKDKLDTLIKHFKNKEEISTEYERLTAPFRLKRIIPGKIRSQGTPEVDIKSCKINAPLEIKSEKVENKPVVAPMLGFYQFCQFHSESVDNRDLPLDGPAQLFPETLLKNEKNPQVQRKMIELNEAYTKAKSKKSLKYTSNTSLHAMEEQIRNNLNTAHIESEEKRAEALKKANAMNQPENLNRRNARQLKEITPIDLTAAYLRQDWGILQARNPELTEEAAKKIFSLLLAGDLAAYKEKQCEEMLALIGDKNISASDRQQKLAEISLRQIDLDRLQKYPQLSVYIAETGLWPRSDQIDAIDWALKALQQGKKLSKEQARMLERSAGFGKTKVFTVIVAQIMASHGFLTTVANIASLYDFGKKDLSESLRAAFMQNMELLEWSIAGQQKITKEKLHDLALAMDSWRQRGHILYIKPETWHLINIRRKEAIATNDEETKLAADIVLEKMRKGLLLVDEGHLVLNPLTEVNRAAGRKENPPKEQVEDMFGNYLFLADQKELLLKKNQQSGVDQKVIASVSAKLIDQICKKAPFNQFNQLKAWLEKPMDADPPVWLWEISKNNPPLFDRIEVQHRFVQGVFQNMMKKRGKIDVGIHSNPQIDYAVPLRDKEETGASYANAIITLASTIQVIVQQGLRRSTFQKFMQTLLDAHHKECDAQIEVGGPTAVEKKLEKILKRPIPLDNFRLGSNVERALYDELKANKEFQKWVIDDQIAAQIVEYAQKYTSTPAEFLNDFEHSIVFTATAGSLDCYPIAFQAKKDQHQLDLEAQAIDLAHMLSERNGKIVTVDPFESEEHLFRQLEKAGVTLENIQFLIDRGGLFRNTKENEDILLGINQILKSKKPGIVAKEVMGERRAYFVDNKIPPKIIPLEGSNLENAMKAAGQNAGALKDAVHVFTIDLCTGTDWNLPEKCEGIFTLGENVTLSAGVQALKRDRKVRLSTHKFTWVVPKNIKEQIKKSENLKPLDLLHWMVKNQVAEEEQLIASSFDQGVDALLAKTFTKETALIEASESNIDRIHQQKFLRACSAKPFLGKVLWKLHKLGIVELISTTKQTYLGLGTPSITWSCKYKGKTFDVEKDATALLGKVFSFQEYQALLRLIERTEKAGVKDFSAIEKERTVEIEEEREKEKEKDEKKENLQEKSSTLGFLSPNQEKYNEDYKLQNIVAGKGVFQEAANFMGWPDRLKEPRLFLSEPFLNGVREYARTKVGVQPKSSAYVRPSDQMLVLYDEEKKQTSFVPLSAKGGDFYREEMKTKVPGWSAAIVNLNGKVLFSQMDPAANKKLEENEDLKKACSLASLAKGEIRGSKKVLHSLFSLMSEKEFMELEANVKTHLIGPGAQFESMRYQALKEEVMM